jgi:hypothetical protein
MKRFIKSFTLNRLTNDGHHKFITNLRYFIIHASPHVRNALIEVLPEFIKLADEEDKIMEVLLNNNLSDLLGKLDALRDGLCHALQTIVSAYAESPFHEDMSMASTLKVISEQFNDIYTVSPEEKSEMLGDFLKKLASYEGLCQHFHLTYILKDLTKATNMYNEFNTEQVDDWANRNIVAFMKEIRMKVDAAYSRIINLLEVAILVGGTNKYSDFVNTLNSYIDAYRSTLRSREIAAKQEFYYSGEFKDKSAILWEEDSNPD